MKKIAIILVVLLFSINSFSQEVNKIVDGVIVKSGNITLKNGLSTTFKNLIKSSDSLSYTNATGEIIKQKTSEILMISKKGTQAGTQALYWGACGLGASVGTILGSGSDDSEFNTGMILGMTAGFAAVGALYGLLFEKQTTVYLNNSSLSFCPDASYGLNGNIYPMLSLRIKF